jgi:hypothetical protein
MLHHESSDYYWGALRSSRNTCPGHQPPDGGKSYPLTEVVYRHLDALSIGGQIMAIDFCFSYSNRVYNNYSILKSTI